VATAILKAEQASGFKICTLLPNPGGAVVDWGRTTFTLSSRSNERFIIVRDDREMSDGKWIAYATLQSTLGILFPGVGGVVIDFFFGEAEVSWAYAGEVLLSVALPGSFALTDQRSRLVDASLTFNIQVTYNFRFVQGGSGTTSPRTVVHQRTNEAVSGRRMVGFDPEIRRQLRARATIHADSHARTTWYRAALRQ